MANNMMIELKISNFIADALFNDLCEGSEDKLKLTQVHRPDTVCNVISVETKNGERFTVTVNKGWQA